MTSGVLVLLIHWCVAHQLDRRSLIRHAYAGRPPYALENLNGVISQALWERVLPPQWSALASRELAHALLDAGYDELTAVFAKTLESAS